jgi:hypothetical protein
MLMPRPAGLAQGPAEPVALVEPTTISVAHWGRLEDGELFARSSYIEWAVMLKRTFGFDAMRCSACGQRMTVLATLTAPEVVRKILDPLHVRSSPLPRAPARDPTWEQTELGFEAA